MIFQRRQENKYNNVTMPVASMSVCNYCVNSFILCEDQKESCHSSAVGHCIDGNVNTTFRARARFEASNISCGLPATNTSTPEATCSSLFCCRIASSFNRTLVDK